AAKRKERAERCSRQEPGPTRSAGIIASRASRRPAQARDFSRDRAGDGFPDEQLQLGPQTSLDLLLDGLCDLRRDRVDDALLQPLLELEEVGLRGGSLGRSLGGRLIPASVVDDLGEDGNVVLGGRARWVVALQERVRLAQDVVRLAHGSDFARSW